MALSQFQIQQLLQGWNNGMKHSDSPLVPEVAETSALTKAQVKNWIGNYRRKVSGRPINKKRMRQPSGYNLFCKEMASKTDERLENCSKERGRAWTSLPEARKQSFIKKAKQTLFEQKDEEKIRKNLKQISSCFQRLNALGCHGFSAVVVPGSDELNLQGTRRGLSYILAQEKITTDFSTSLQNNEIPTKKNEQMREELRRQVQELFKQKFKEVHGPQSRLSYKKNNVVEGLPEGMTLKKPSGYGLASLKAIIAGAAQIQFKKTDGGNKEEAIKRANNERDDQTVDVHAEQNVTLQPIATLQPEATVEPFITLQPVANHLSLEPSPNDDFPHNAAEKVLSDMAAGNMDVAEATLNCSVLSAVEKTPADKSTKRGKKRKAGKRTRFAQKKEKTSKTIKGED